MPITSSAKKAYRSSLRKRVFNLRRKEGVKEVTKKIKKLLASKNIAGARTLLPAAYQAIDKAAKAHTWNRAAAARRKSRIAALINNTSPGS